MNKSLRVEIRVKSHKIKTDTVLSNFIKSNNGKITKEHYINGGMFIKTFLIDKKYLNLMINKLEVGEYPKGYGLSSYSISCAEINMNMLKLHNEILLKNAMNISNTFNDFNYR